MNKSKLVKNNFILFEGYMGTYFPLKIIKPSPPPIKREFISFVYRADNTNKLGLKALWPLDLAKSGFKSYSLE